MRTWFRDLRITRKILAAAIVVALIAAAAGWVLVGSLNRARDLSEQAQEITLELVQLRKLRLAVDSLDGATARYLLTGDADWRRIASEDLLAVEGGLATAAAREDRVQQELRDSALGAIEDYVYGVLTPALTAADAVYIGGADPQTLAPYEAALLEEQGQQVVGDALDVYVDEVQARGVRDALVAQQQAQLGRVLEILIGTMALIVAVTALLLWLLGRSLSRRFGALEAQADLISAGTLTEPVSITGRDEAGNLADRIESMRRSLLASRDANEALHQRRELALLLTSVLQSDAPMAEADAEALRTLLAASGCLTGTLYLADGQGGWRLAAVHGTDSSQPPPSEATPGEGLGGQALANGEAVFAGVGPGHLGVTSSLGTSDPAEVAAIPCSSAAEVEALVEAGSATGFTAEQRELLDSVAGVLGTQYRLRRQRELNERLLVQSQQQTEELSAQSDELQRANLALETSAVELEERQEEIATRNTALEQAQDELVSRAEEIDRASKYKSAFLATMSHELRTPLNSIMILSERLGDNAQGNLSDQQVEFAQTIASCGNDLLALINDVLDLSKIEAGRSTLEIAPVSLPDLAAELRRQFGPMAEAKGLALEVDLPPDLPETITTDRTRLAQILRNLLSNAVKFTHEGKVRLALRLHDGVMQFQVIDTGPGIAEKDREAVFQPFSQLDNGIRRQAGGTGLGMAISRELAQRLGGSLDFTSELGSGTVFDLLLPVDAPEDLETGAAPAPATTPHLATPYRDDAPRDDAPPAPHQSPSTPAAPDDQSAGPEPGPDDPVLLIIEDDAIYGGILADIARQEGLVPVLAASGQAAKDALGSLRPRAITLDLGLPDVDGWVLLDWLRHHPTTRHTPIHIISVSAGAEAAEGVIGVLTKPASQAELATAMARLERTSGDRPRHVLAVKTREGGSPLDTTSFGEQTPVVSVSGIDAAREALREDQFEALVIDVLDPSDTAPARELLAGLDRGHLPAVVVLLPDGEDAAPWRGLAGATITKDEAGRARLIDEVTRFLRLSVAELSATEQALVSELYRSDRSLAGRTILIVDDNARNVFSLASALEEHGVQILDAENGQEALDLLADHPEVDLVLMDAMMPVMDGLTATTRIRQNPGTANLPVIVVTALAMPDDRRRAMAAGASDYVTKPVDIEQLLAMIRVRLDGRPA